MAIEKDRGYSWLVMVAALFSHLMYGSSTFGFVSVLMHLWVERFTISTETASWAPSVMSGTLFITGPIISLIIKPLGCWKTQLIGVILSIAGSICVAFSSQFWHVILSFSLLQAFGYAMTQLATYDVVAMYFQKHKDKVYAGLFSFYCAGLLVGPTFIEFLIKNLEYKYAMLLVSGINILNVPTAFIYRGFNRFHQKDTEKDDNITATDIVIEKSDNDSKQQVGPRVDNSQSTVKVDSKSHKSGQPSRWHFLVIHKKVLTQPSFIVILVYYFFCCAGENSFYALAVEFTISKGVLNLEQAALGMTLCGVSTVVGSLFLAVLSHWTFSRMTLSLVTTIFLGLAMILMPIAGNLTSVYSLMIIFGFVDSLFAANIMSLVAQVFTDNDLMIIRLSYVFCVIGLGSLAGPVVATNVSAVAGIDSMFYLLGGCPLLALLILLPLWIYKTCWQQ